MTKAKILVCCHKAWDVPNDDVFTPIHVGKVNASVDLGFIGDDTGDNISNKNKGYCELTALYWAWKNMRDVDFIGLNHYRRFFDVKIRNAEDVKRILGNADIVLPKKEILGVTNGFYFQSFVTMENRYLMQATIAKLFPEYRKEMVDYYYNSNGWNRFNMFITSRDVFDGFCNFMFPILEELETLVRPSGYTRINRFYGYVGETLWQIYARHNRLKVKYIEPIETQRTKERKIVQLYRSIIFNMSFYICHPVKAKLPKYSEAVITGLKADGFDLSALKEDRGFRSKFVNCQF